MFAFLSRTIGDRAAAEDLVQDVFVRILKYRHTFRDNSCFETWLFRIVRNARADHFKRRAAAESLNNEAFEVTESQPGPAQILESRQDVARLQRPRWSSPRRSDGPKRASIDWLFPSVIPRAQGR